MNHMKLNISKELAISAGVGVLIGILVLSYASNNNFNRLGTIESSSPVYDLAQKILSARNSDAIDNKGLANSLASKVMAAYKALGNDDSDTAIAALQDFVSHANDQSGKHITIEVASELITEAEAVIDALEDITPVECDPMCIRDLCGDFPAEFKPQCEIDACSPGGDCYPQ